MNSSDVLARSVDPADGSPAARPTDYLEQDWSAEEFTRGCYGAHFGPGVWTGYGDSTAEAILAVQA